MPKNSSNLTEAIVSQLGQPRDTSVSENIGIAVMLISIVAVICGAEWFVGWSVTRLVRWTWGRFIALVERNQPE